MCNLSVKNKSNFTKMYSSLTTEIKFITFKANAGKKKKVLNAVPINQWIEGQTFFFFFFL